MGIAAIHARGMPFAEGLALLDRMKLSHLTPALRSSGNLEWPAL